MRELALVLALLVLLTLLGALIALVRVLRVRENGRSGSSDSEVDPRLLPALAQARDDVRRAQRLALIASTLDLDEVLGQLVEAAASDCGADGAAVMLRQRDGSAIVKTYRLADNESAPSLRERWDDTPASAVTLQYAYPAGHPERTNPIRTGLFVPIITEADEQIGTLAVYWRTEHDTLPDELAALEELARSSARLIENARRFKEASELAVLDELTRLYNRRFFYDELAREVKRARRYGRSLAVIVFDLDNFKVINDEIGHLGGDTVLAEVADRLRSVLRGADIACRIGGDEFAVILPEATLDDAEQLYRRLQIAMEGRPIGRAEKLTLSGGIADAQEDDDAVSLFQRADQALFRAKREGGRQFVVRGEGF